MGAMAAGGVLAEAFVEVGLRATGFESALETQVEGPLKDVATTAEKTGVQMEAAFTESAERSAQRLQEILGGDAFTSLRAAAAEAGASVEAAMADAAAGSDAALGTIGDTAFADAAAEAEATAALITDAMDGAAIESDAALSTIGDSAFVSAAAEADVAAASIATSFTEAAVESEAALSGIGAAAGASLAETGVAARGAAGGLGLIGKATGAVTVLAGLGFAAKKFLDAGRESTRVGNVTNSVIKSTGGVAGVSAEQVAALATKLSLLTGIDDEAIQGNENLLLTFTNVRDAAGAGNDVFTQTVGLAQDMATVLGTDASGAALQLGKALNDPVKGITALARAGVSFTADQKEQIKDLVAHNDLLGAQKIILGEVTREFGGAATAAADPMGKLAVQLGNVAEAIGQHLMPVLTPALDTVTAFASVHAEAIGAGVGAAVTGLASGFASLARVGWAVIGPGLESVVGLVGQLAPIVGPVARDVASFVKDALEPLGTWASNNQGAVDAISTGLVTLAGGVAAVALASKASSSVTEMAKALDLLFKAAEGDAAGGALAALATPVGIVVLVVAALGAAAVVAYQKWQPFRDAVDDTASFFVDTVWPAIQNIASALTDTLGPAVTTVTGIIGGIDWGGVFDTLTSAASTAADAVGTATDAIAGAFRTVANTIQRAIGPTVEFLIGLWAQYGDEVTGILVGFRDIAVAVFTRVATIVGDFVSTLQAVLIPAFEFVQAAASVAWTVISDQIGLAIDVATIAITTFVDFMTPVWEALWGFVSDVVAGAVGPIRDAIEGVLRVIQGVVDIVAGIFTGDWQRIWDGVSEIVSGAVELVTAQLDQVLNFLEAVWTNAEDLITAPFRGGWAALQDLVSGGVTIVEDLFNGVLDFLGSVWKNATTLITAPIQAAIALAEGFINQISSTIGELPGKAAAALVGLASSIAGAIGDAAVAAVSKAGELVTDVLSKIGELASKIPGALASLGGSVVSGLGSMFKGWWNEMVDHLPSVSFGGVEVLGHTVIPSFDFDPGSFLHMAGGGVVPGNPMTGDSVPALLQPGEMTLTAAQQILLAQAAQGGSGGNLIMQGPHYWGAPMSEAVKELDWATRYRMRTVT